MWPALPVPSPTWDSPRHVQRVPAGGSLAPHVRWRAHNHKAAARRWSSRSSTAASPVQVQDCGIQRLKGGLNVGQPLAVPGGQAASSGAVAASPCAAWPAVTCSCWIAACCRSARTPLNIARTRASTLAASPDSSCDLVGDLASNPTLQGRRPACRGTSPSCWPQRVEVGQSAVGRSDGPAVRYCRCSAMRDRR